MAKFKNKPPAKVVPGPAIYVGPNMGGNVPMSQFTVFKNGFPPYVAEKMKAEPDFKRLFVPVADLNAARIELKKPASVRARAFNAVLKNRGVK